MSEAVRAEVALGCRVLAVAGLGDLVWGHLSARDLDGRGVWIKASGWGFDEVDAQHVVLVDDTGSVVEGEGGCPIEFPIHTEIIATRPDVGAVVHAHPTYAIAFAATGPPMRPISHDGAFFVPPELPRFIETGGLVRTRALGASLAKSLGAERAVLMPHHGVATVGSNVPEAVMAAVLLERSCRLQLLADATGGAATWSSDEEALAKRETCWTDAQISAGWEYLVRHVNS